MKIKNAMISLFMVMILCFSALPALGVDPVGSFYVSEYYVVEKKVNGVVHEFMSPANNGDDKCAVAVDGTVGWIDINTTKTINGVEMTFLSFLTIHNGDGSTSYACLIQPTGSVQDVSSGCDSMPTYEEDEDFTFNGVLVRVDDIDVEDRRVTLKFLESGITYDMDIGHEAERDGVNVKLIGITRSAEPTATLCLKATGTPLEPMPPFIAAVDNTAPASDVIILTDAITGMAYEGYDMHTVGISKLFSEVNAQMLDNMVTLAVYHGEAVIIVGAHSPASHAMFATDLVQVLNDQGRISSHRVILSSEVPSADLIDLFVDEPEPAVFECTESDEVSYYDEPGLNYYRKGTACVGDGTTETCRTDYCSGDSVVEFYLENEGCNEYTDIFSKTRVCPNGCVSGKCYYPGYYLEFDKDKYYSGDVIEFEIRAADSGTAYIHLYIMPYDTDEKILVKPNLLVQGIKTVEIDTDRYGNIFDSTDNYLFLVTDATTEGVGGGIGTNSRATEFVKSTSEPYEEEVPACRDSDGGRNMYVRGTTTGTVACTHQESCNIATSTTDSCNGDVLNEYVCDIDPRYNVKRKYVNFIECEHGCSNGACIREVQEGKPDLVIKNLQFVKKNKDLSTIEFDIYNQGTVSTSGKFPIAVYVDGRMHTHTIWYDSIAPNQKIHKELSNYKWLSSATFSRTVTIVVDRFEGSEEDNPLYRGFYNNMIAESSEYNNKVEMVIKGTQQEVPVYNRYTLADYPELYISHGRFNGYIVVGDRAPASDVVAAVDIATAIQYSTESTYTSTGSTNTVVVNKIEVGAAKLASEIVNPMKMNIISVGNACNNAVTDELKGHPEPCKKGLTNGEGRIQLYQYNGKPQIIVDGYSDQDVRKAAKVLADYDSHSLRGTCMVIRGDFNYPKAYPCGRNDIVTPEVPFEEEIIPPTVVPDAEGDCSAGSCPVDNTCVALGIRLVDGGTPSYCDFNGFMRAQKGDGNSCQNDYECLSNSCGNGRCQDFGERLSTLEQEMRETQGILNRLMSWIRSWFGGGNDYEEPEVIEDDVEVPESSSSVIENDFGVLTYDSTSVSNFCDFVQDTSCRLYAAEYNYNGKSARIVAGVEVHPAQFTNQQAIDGIMGEFGKEGYTVQRESTGGNSVYLFTGGQYPNHQYLAAWYSGKNVVALYVDNSPAVLTDAELDDVFEDSLAKYYLAMYPSDLAFE